MKSISIITILFFQLLNQQNLVAQQTNSVKASLVNKYKKFLDPKAELVSINYYQSIEKNEREYIKKTYNPDKLILITLQTISILSADSMVGYTKEYYDNGKLWKEGKNKGVIKNGLLRFYDFEGRVKRYGKFTNNLEEETWYDLDILGRKVEVSHYKNGKLDGPYLKCDTLGKVYYKEIYKSGEVISRQIIDSSFYFKDFIISAKWNTCKDFHENLFYGCTVKEFLNYLYSKIKYPDSAIQNYIEGNALFNFIIDIDGKLIDIEPYRSVCNEIEKECIRILKISPKWKAGTLNGIPIRVSYTIPITFKLE
jgi:antitoxin component YwqK of YwqJK toxin-antitoxin module